jgi:hypothetical protein
MKKIFLIGLFLLVACDSSTPEPTFTPQATATRFFIATVPVSSPQGATVTPTIIPSPTVTPPPPPPKRYFTEEFDGALDYWSTLYAAGESSQVDILNESGKLTFELYSPAAWMYAIYGAFEYESVHIETLVESRGSEVNSMGLVCHYDEQDGWYEFNISNDGIYNLLYGQWLAEGVARYTPILIDASERIALGNSTNQIGLDCYENIVQLYINEKLIRKMDVSRYELMGGKVGLSLASFEDLPVILSFDWVKVSEP